MISTAMALSQGHTDLHCDNSQIWYYQQDKNYIHSVKTSHTVQQPATQTINQEQTVHWISLHFNCEADEQKFRKLERW